MSQYGGGGGGAKGAKGVLGTTERGGVLDSSGSTVVFPAGHLIISLLCACGGVGGILSVTTGKGGGGVSWWM